MNTLIPLVLLGGMLSVAVYHEMLSRRIPNWLTFPGMILGLSASWLFGGIPGVIASAGGLLTGMAAFIVFYLFGGVGGGDVKLMAAIGAVMGWRVVLPTIFWVAIIGGLISMVALIRGQRGVPYGLAIAAGTWIAIIVTLT